jgi:hypothetical protein
MSDPTFYKFDNHNEIYGWYRETKNNEDIYVLLC